MTRTEQEPTAALPELGPWLGRLPEIAPRDRGPDLVLDPVRLALVTALFERAAAARDFLTAGDPEGARAALDRSVWLEAWRPAVAAVGDRTLAAIGGRLERAARSSGAPRRRLLAALPQAEDRALLRARLDAAGAQLETELGRLTRDSTDWLGALRRAAAALEESWDELETTARGELVAWSPAARALEAWRPPRALRAGTLAVLALAAGWLGLALGGVVARPGWLEPVAAWFWSLPWP